MKILYDHQIFSISRYGGALRYFCELIKRLSQDKDIEVSLFMGYFVSEYGLENFDKYFRNYFGKKHKPYPNSKLFFLFLNKLLFKKFIRKTEADIYHQTYYENICLNRKEKRIVTVLDMMHELYPGSFNKLDKSSFQKKEAVKKADGIICISHSTKKDLIEILKVPEKKIRVIHLGNSLDVLPKGEPLVKQPYFLYVAKRQGYKNFNMLLSVFADLKKNFTEFKLVCCGGGDFTTEESGLINSYNIKNDLLYFNAGDEILANLYKNATAFVYPSLYEGFGVSLLEAMNMECPIIASNQSSIPEILGDAGLYIDPKSTEDLKDKMEKLIYDKKLREDLIKKGLIQKEKFSWDKCAKETLDYYEEILGK
jgi:glycosyltransferase involved in cell wall biosynthesis